MTLVRHLNVKLPAKSGLVDWERKLTQNWFNFQNLTIISWHNACGA
jgi:hypothetical protein